MFGLGRCGCAGDWTGTECHTLASDTASVPAVAIAERIWFRYLHSVHLMG
jgi:hypothetical protein